MIPHVYIYIYYCVLLYILCIWIQIHFRHIYIYIFHLHILVHTQCFKMFQFQASQKRCMIFHEFCRPFWGNQGKLVVPEVPSKSFLGHLESWSSWEAWRPWRFEALATSLEGRRDTKADNARWNWVKCDRNATSFPRFSYVFHSYPWGQSFWTLICEWMWWMCLMDLMLIYVIFFVGRPSCCCFMGLHWSGKNKESGRILEPKYIYDHLWVFRAQGTCKSFCFMLKVLHASTGTTTRTSLRHPLRHPWQLLS